MSTLAPSSMARRATAEPIPVPAAAVTTASRHICSICGYVYDPVLGDPEHDVPAGTAFEDLPADWTCPVCGAGKDQFEPEG